MNIVSIGEALLYVGITTYVLSFLVPNAVLVIDFYTMTGHVEPNPVWLALAISICLLVGTSLTIVIVLLRRVK